MSEKDGEERSTKTQGSIIEARKLESYAEHVTSEMRSCHYCQRICYKEVPTKRIGRVHICIDCVRDLKDTVDDLDRWENELNIKKKTEKQFDKGLGLDED